MYRRINYALKSTTHYPKYPGHIMFFSKILHRSSTKRTKIVWLFVEFRAPRSDWSTVLCAAVFARESIHCFYRALPARTPVPGTNSPGAWIPLDHLLSPCYLNGQEGSRQEKYECRASRGRSGHRSTHCTPHDQGKMDEDSWSVLEDP